MVDPIALVKRAKVNELARDYHRFALGPLTNIVETVHHQKARVFISKHFPERMVDRNFAKREDRHLMFRLLSYAFEMRGDQMLQDQDIFIKYKDIAVMIFSEFRDNIQQIRLNTFLHNDENTWMKSKNGRKMVTIEIDPKELIDYTPITMKMKEAA